MPFDFELVNQYLTVLQEKTATGKSISEGGGVAVGSGVSSEESSEESSNESSGESVETAESGSGDESEENGGGHSY